MKNFLLKTWLILVCLLCGAGTMWGADVTVTKTVNQLKEANNWTASSGSTINGTYRDFDLDNNINVKLEVGAAGNSGSIWGSTTYDWRLYQANSPIITISSKGSCVIKSVKFTYTSSNNGVINTKGCEKSVASNYQIKSGTAYDVNASSAIYYVGNTSTATNGQARITAIEVVYSSTSGGGSTPTALSVPTNLSSSNVTTTGATLSWDAVANASSYTVKIGSTEYTKVTTTSYNATGLTAGTPYTWTVKAVGDGTNYSTSAYATDANFTTEAEQGGGETGATEKNYEFASMTDFADWGTSYEKRTNTFSDGAYAELANANHNTSTITDCPVTKGNDVIFKAPEGKIITSLTFTCRQWTTKSQTITLNTSTDGTNYTATSTTSSNFVLSASNLSNVSAVKFTFSSKDQIGIESIKVTYIDASDAPDIPTLRSITISGTPNKTSYLDGDAFAPDGLTVTGYYSDESTADLTVAASWSVPEALVEGQTSVEITATINGITSAPYTVQNLTVSAIPEKTIAEFIESKGGKCYLTGIVSNITNLTYGNFYLTDETGTVFVFGCLTPKGEAKKFETLDVVAGDKIKVLANEYGIYNEDAEAKNVIFVEEIPIEKPQFTVTIETPANGTLEVKEGENILSSGAEVEEGKTLTIECTPANDDYRFKNWQAIDATTHTFTTTFTYVVTGNVTIKANFELIPTYTVAFSVNGAIVQTDDLKEGAAVTVHANPEAINGKVFTGWIETATVEGETPAYVTPATTATKTITYYAVFATKSAGGGDPVFSKYEEVTTAPADWSGNYIMVADNKVVELNGNKTSEMQLSSTAFFTTTEQTNKEVVVAKRNQNYTIYLNEKKMYLAQSGTSTSITMDLDNTGNNFEWVLSTTGIQSVSASTRYLMANGTVVKCYTPGSSYKYVKLFKRIMDDGTTYSDYCTKIKTTPTLSFAEAIYNATMGEDFDAPELTNPQEVSVTYSSSAEGVATVDSKTGAVTLVGAGTTTITATFTGNENYLEASARYTLVVEAATTPEPTPVNGTLNFVATNNDGYWATFTSTDNVIFDANDVVVYTVAVEGKSVVKIEATGNSLSCVTDKTKDSGWVAGYYVQAGSAVLINSVDQSVNYYYVDTDPYTPNQLSEVETDPEYNMLRPASVAKETDGSYLFYKLAYGDWENKTKLGFWWGAEKGGPFESKAGGVYLAVPVEVVGNSNMRGFSFEPDTRPTGIESISNDVVAGEIYNLQGQRINRLQQGVNIVNGKKVIR